MKKTVFLFPGQGAQKQGMALDFLAAGIEKIRRLFDAASRAAGMDLEKILREGDDETLKRADVAQPAITLTNLAAAAYLESKGVTPAACAGHSLGEYAALAACGVVSAEDCFHLAAARGRAMQKACENITGAGMSAIIGLHPDKVIELIGEWKIPDLYAANVNSPKQLVVSGSAAALDEAEKRFKEAGARRAIRLPVAGPFHSPFMQSAADEFVPVLEAVTFNDPAVPFYSNVSGGRAAAGAEAKKLALAQITSPVRWTTEEQAIIDAGNFDAVIECGPGTALAGMWGAIGAAVECTAAGTAADCDAFLESSDQKTF